VLIDTGDRPLTALHREQLGVARRPVRIVHIGLGAFFRAHAAWYTDRVDTSGEWGIHAFTGRAPAAASILSAQDDLYTLVERGPDEDAFTLVTVLSATGDGTDDRALGAAICSPATAIITVTITEAGYTPADRDGDGVPARLAAGLSKRMRGGGGPLAIVSCDNLSRNGDILRAAVLAGQSSELAGWIESNVSFVNTSVDRITPRTTEAERREAAAASGYADAAPVITEPYHAWILSGAFPAGRPRWEDAGAIFVDDIDGYVIRKLWLLNGAHSLLAYSGRLRGHRTVSEAMDDELCRVWLNEFWDTTSALLPEPLAGRDYTFELERRFCNPRIVHDLDQIATDGVVKLRSRVLPILQAAEESDVDPRPIMRVICCWIANVLSLGPLNDGTPAAGLDAAAATDDPVLELLRVISPGLSGNDRMVEQCRGLLSEILPVT
jgi:fructuronate reductase